MAGPHVITQVQSVKKKKYQESIASQPKMMDRPTNLLRVILIKIPAPCQRLADKQIDKEVQTTI